MKVLILMHVDQEGPGLIEDCSRELAIPYEIRNLGAGAALPKLDDFTHIVILGGPMNVYEEDRYPFLGREDLFIKEALQRGKSVLGICLGAQLMAKALGARVFRAPVKEIGWFEVSLTSQGLADPLFAGFPKTFSVFQWHGDTFDLPKGAQLLATSPAVLHQAFRYGEAAYGLQFHLEVTEGMVRQWMEGYEEEFAAGSVPPYTKDQILKDTVGKMDFCLLWGRKFFRRFLGEDISSSFRHG
jgi:GMP synthase (glutamine-hydrolysing)